VNNPVLAQIAGVLLDTDVFSYLVRPGEPRRDLYTPHLKGKLTALTYISIGELRYGARCRRWGTGAIAELEARLAETIVLPFDAKICDEYAALKARLRLEVPNAR